VIFLIFFTVLIVYKQCKLIVKEVQLLQRQTVCIKFTNRIRWNDTKAAITPLRSFKVDFYTKWKHIYNFLLVKNANFTSCFVLGKPAPPKIKTSRSRKFTVGPETAYTRLKAFRKQLHMLTTNFQLLAVGGLGYQ